MEKDGKILLVRESQAFASGPGPDHGKWSHPAGWIDVGEDPVEAVKREVLEESGFVFTPQHILGIYSLVRRDIEKKLEATPHALKIIFSGTIPDHSQKSLADDVSEIGWFSPEEIYAMDAETLRDVDIKQIVRDYTNGKKYPLDVLRHTVA